MSLQINRPIKHFSKGISVANKNTDRLILNIMLWSLGALAIFYVFILGNMVFNIVERRSLEEEARNLSTEVSDLELSYLTLSNNVDLNLSHSLGFKEIKAEFATRKSLGSLGGATLSQNEI